jgi:tetratricopeptide (TPR) repeat protein
VLQYRKALMDINFMEPNIFSPRLQRITKDNIVDFLKSISQLFLILAFGLLPIFFIPGVYASLGFTKTYLVIVGVFISTIFISLAILRSGYFKVSFPFPLALFWAFSATAVVSALLSGDRQDALYGNALEVHTAGFILLLAVIITLASVFGNSKAAISRLFLVLGGSAILVQTFHLLRLVFGPEFLSFSLFTTNTASVIGSFNDLALFSGLVVVVTLVAVQQISVRVLGAVISTFLVVSSLILLSLINFYLVWLTVGFLSLLMFLYLISKDTWLRLPDSGQVRVSKFTLALVGFVCVVSGAFIISGDYLGAKLSQVTGITYLEVRPSIGTTLQLTKSAFSEDILLGVGPNRFEDAWRQYKDPIINQTLFWNTNFSAGSGFIPTLFVTTGALGGLLFISFLLAFIYLGYKTFFATKIDDFGWSLVGTISFVSAIYLWIMSAIYVPGATIMLLAALATGLSIAVYRTVIPKPGLLIDISQNRQYGILLIASVLVVIITATLSLVGVSKQYLANVSYAKAVLAFQSGAAPAEVDGRLSRSQDLTNQDMFLSERAQLRLLELNQLLSLVEPTALDQQKFGEVFSQGINLTEQAILLDQSNPVNYVLLANFYSALDPAQFAVAKDRVYAAVEEARKIDPTNPIYLISLAQYSARVGDLIATRNYLTEAIKLKSDYTDALFLLSQLDIQEGNTDAAIEVTRSIISIEPMNPTRYFQLGILLATKSDINGAIDAFETSVGLDNNYANARYFLALTYIDAGRTDEALTQLRLVAETNPDAEIVKNIIKQIESGSFERPQAGFNVPVQEENNVSQEGDVTTTNEAPDTDLVTPVNTVGKPETEQNNNNSNPVEEIGN